MLELFNTMSRSKEVFKPIDPKIIKMFACGPSIYQRPHIGNYRTFLYEDILIKYLEYSGYKVRHTTILTDIENKSISEAKKKNQKVNRLTSTAAKFFFKEAKLLQIKLPDPVPRSSTSIDQSVLLIKKLLDSGYAYIHKGDIFFDALNFKEFGKLFRLDMSRWPEKKVRFRKDTYNGRRWNLGDFILWHGYKDGDLATWDTKIGKGWPSWNIQDPAVITKHLGYGIDINCGGIDNIYRHHDYTIAIVESVSKKPYANYYLHGEHLIVNGKSMSKSRGNIMYPEALLKKHCLPYHLRFFLLYRHYRKKLNFTDQKFKNSCDYIDLIRKTISGLLTHKDRSAESHPEAAMLINRIKTEFEKNMNNDLEFGIAVDTIFSILKKLEILQDKNEFGLKDIPKLKGILQRINAVTGVLF
ncbi:MAG: class I tRNA ligase family protein [Spirochaetes bacterium]|nr:class I tRNA ligase family protein [Spirochaetota bacterium]